MHIDEEVTTAPTTHDRLEEAQHTIEVLNARVTELQTLASTIENERRMWKHRATTMRLLLDVAIVELPIGAQAVANEIGQDAQTVALIERAFGDALRKVDEVAKRNALLEADAWCKAVNIAREFIKDSERLLAPSEFVLAYVERFKNAFDS